MGDKRNGAYVGKPIILKLLRFSNLNFVLIYVVIVYDCAIRTKEVRAAHWVIRLHNNDCNSLTTSQILRVQWYTSTNGIALSHTSTQSFERHFPYALLCSSHMDLHHADNHISAGEPALFRSPSSPEDAARKVPPELPRPASAPAPALAFFCSVTPWYWRMSSGSRMGHGLKHPAELFVCKCTL